MATSTPARGIVDSTIVTAGVCGAGEALGQQPIDSGRDRGIGDVDVQTDEPVEPGAGRPKRGVEVAEHAGGLGIRLSASLQSTLGIDGIQDRRMHERALVDDDRRGDAAARIGFDRTETDPSRPLGPRWCAAAGGHQHHGRRQESLEGQDDSVRLAHRGRSLARAGRP